MPVGQGVGLDRVAAVRGIEDLERQIGVGVKQSDGEEQALMEGPLPVSVQDLGSVQQAAETFFLQRDHAFP